MSILIKGIDMPKVNETRMIAITQNGVAFFSTVKDGETSKSEKTEAIQIPTPHGRLIDWDAFNSKLDIQYAEGRGKALAPTILEEEK